MKTKSAGAICYECKYRKPLDGDAHSRCTHPEDVNLEMKFNEAGKRLGVFRWPDNFDPNFLISCEGFVKLKEE